MDHKRTMLTGNRGGGEVKKWLKTMFLRFCSATTWETTRHASPQFKEDVNGYPCVKFQSPRSKNEALTAR